jgi:hypothetical protein
MFCDGSSFLRGSQGPFLDSLACRPVWPPTRSVAFASSILKSSEGTS